jgi:hypothetical protein
LAESSSAKSLSDLPAPESVASEDAFFLISADPSCARANVIATAVSVPNHRAFAFGFAISASPEKGFNPGIADCHFNNRPILNYRASYRRKIEIAMFLSEKVVSVLTFPALYV